MDGIYSQISPRVFNSGEPIRIQVENLADTAMRVGVADTAMRVGVRVEGLDSVESALHMTAELQPCGGGVWYAELPVLGFLRESAVFVEGATVDGEYLIARPA